MEEFLMAASWENGVWAMGLNIKAELSLRSFLVFVLMNHNVKKSSVKP